MVSAPCSARSFAQNAPEGACASSITFTSESIPYIASPSFKIVIPVGGIQSGFRLGPAFAGVTS